MRLKGPASTIEGLPAQPARRISTGRHLNEAGGNAYGGGYQKRQRGRRGNPPRHRYHPGMTVACARNITSAATSNHTTPASIGSRFDHRLARSATTMARVTTTASTPTRIHRNRALSANPSCCCRFAWLTASIRDETRIRTPSPSKPQVIQLFTSFLCRPGADTLIPSFSTDFAHHNTGVVTPSHRSGEAL